MGSQTILANTSETVISESVPFLNVTGQLSCPPIPSTTPILLTHGVLPPILVASLAYILIVVLIMGLIRPAFLELSPLQSLSHQSSIKIRNSDNCSTIEEVEE